MDEFPSEEDIERFSDVLQTCPECGTDLYDDALVCFHCGHHLGSNARPIPGWVLIAGVLAAAGIVLWTIL